MSTPLYSSAATEVYKKQVFKHRSDPTRVRIFWLLSHREECVINIAAILNMSSPAVSHHLRSLTESDDAQIRYFSGTAVYTRDFDVKGYNKRATYRLDLGGVGCMAEVYLNDQMLGTLWKAPYAIDITPALKKKGNKLEVRVTNLWANRVIGDKQPDKKKRYAWASYNNAFRASSKPLPAGLLGGVRLLCTPAGK